MVSSPMAASIVPALPPTLVAKFSEGFEPSGKLDHPSWKEAPVVYLDTGWDGQAYPELKTEVRFLWEPEYFYAGFHCPFQALNIDPTPPLDSYRWGLWDYDMVELHLSSETLGVCNYRELEAAPTGHWMDLDVVFYRDKPFYDWEWRSGFQVRAEILKDPRVWTLEMKIPARSVAERALEAGMTWSINVYRADGKGQARKYLAWMPTYTEKPNYHVPSRFDRIKFLK